MMVDVGATLAPALWVLAFVLVVTAAAIVAGRERPEDSGPRRAPWRLRVCSRNSA
jgi:hypothetical protein